jgi:hypothetical protein
LLKLFIEVLVLSLLNLIAYSNKKQAFSAILLSQNDPVEYFESCLNRLKFDYYFSINAGFWINCRYGQARLSTKELIIQ